MDDNWRSIIRLLPTFGHYANVVFEYVELFGVTPLRVKPAKVLRVLSDVAKLFSSNSFRYRKKLYSITTNGIGEALVVVCNKSFSAPLENHNYLKKVMIGIVEQEHKQKNIENEKTLRKKERAIMSGNRPEEKREDDGRISVGEYKKRQGIENLTEGLFNE